MEYLLMARILVASPADVAGSPNTRTHHLVRHLAPYFDETIVISRSNISHRSYWSAIFRMRTKVIQEGAIRWISLCPWGRIRDGLGLYIIGLANPYAVPKGGIRRFLRRFMSLLGVFLELGVFPSLVMTYVLRCGGRINIFIGEGPWEITLGLFLRAIGRVQHVVYDDMDYHPGFQPISSLRQRVIAALEQFGVQRADVVVSVGEQLAGLRRKQGGRNIFVIPNGVNVELFMTASLLRDKAGPRRPTLIYMGYLGTWAGVDLILDIAAIVVRQFPDLRVILLGHGYPLEIESLCTGIRDLGLSNVVEFRGQVPYHELPAHLAEADIGLAMFRPLELTRYAFPLKVVEYMAAGLPVVTTTDTEAAELVTRTHAGMAVPYDASTAATAITKIMKDTEMLRRFAENSKAHSKEYDWKRIMEKFYSLIKPHCSYDNSHRNRASITRKRDL